MRSALVFRSSFLVGAGLATYGTACQPDRDLQDGWQGSVDTLPNGVVVVSNPSEGIWDSTSAWRLESVFRLGSADGTGADVFAQIMALEADDTGRLYVLDGISQEVRVFDPNGQHLRTFGGPGEGPGEFRGANGLGWGPDRHLWVVDQRLNRFTLFDSLGSVVDTRRVPMSIRSYVWQGSFTASGEMFDLGHVRVGDDSRAVLLRFDGIMTYSDTMFLPAPEPQLFSFRDERGAGGMTQIPFAPQHVWTLSPSGVLWTSDAHQYRIQRVIWPGDTTMTIVRDAPPIPVTSQERADGIERVDEFMRGHRYDASRIPEFKPPLVQIIEDERGFLWIRRPDAADAAGSAFDIFDERGRFLGSLTTEFTVSSYPRSIIRGDRLYHGTLDDLDVQYVVAYEILR